VALALVAGREVADSSLSLSFLLRVGGVVKIYNVALRVRQPSDAIPVARMLDAIT
jgi:hypothetical protein